MRTGMLAALVMLGALAALDAQGGKPLSNDTVINLVKAGMGERVVVASVNGATAVQFDVSPEGLVALKRAKVPDAVIEAMVMKMAAVTAAAPASVGSSSGPTDPALAFLRDLTPGIYMTRTTGTDPRHFVALEPTVITRMRTAGGFKRWVSGGLAKSEMIAELRGTRASIRTPMHTPTFYFVFGRTATDIGSPFVGWLASATSPNEFALIQMYSGDGGRDLVIARGNSFTSNAGLESENTVEVSIERLSPGVYRVTPNEPLGEGEFCWFYAAGISSLQSGDAVGKIFDFGVDPAR